jgi:hypothetical protein
VQWIFDVCDGCPDRKKGLASEIAAKDVYKLAVHRLSRSGRAIGSNTSIFERPRLDASHIVVSQASNQLVDLDALRVQRLPFFSF